MMMWVGVGLFVAVLVVLFVLAEKFLPQKKQAGLEYVLRGPLLTKAEAAFYPVLVEAVKAGPEACVVMCKVRLGDVIRPRTGLEKSERTTRANKVDRKHLDFVVVRASDFGVVMGVELDDSSHRREKVKERDAFVDAAMASAGLRVVRVKWGRGYGLEKVAAALWDEVESAVSQNATVFHGAIPPLS